MRRIFTIGSIIVLALIGIVIICITTFVIKPKDKVNAAEEYTLTVNKVSTISVYVSGQGVKLKNSNLDVDVYTVEENTEVIIRAINESRIFQSWVVMDDNNQALPQNGATTSMLSFVPNSNMNIATIRKDATAEDYGRYMYNRFLIETAQDLIDLQDIIAYGNNVKNTDTAIIQKYDNFYDKFNEYINLTTNKEKVDFIINHNLYDRLQTGYFLVANSLSLYDENFTGIGNKNRPFRGVMCGLSNNEISSIFLTVSTIEASGDNYYGLFGYLDKEAVVRNLNITTSIGISKNDNIRQNTIYAGGMAGEINEALISNVTLKLSIGINANDATIYVGGIAGKMSGGLDEVNTVKYDGNQGSWIIQSNSSHKIYTGLVSGLGTNVYVNSFDVDTSGLSIDISNFRTGNYNTNIDIYAGNLFGYLDITKNTRINNIHFNGNQKQTLYASINIGNAYIGGLIGYAHANASLDVGVIQFNNSDSEQSLFMAQSLDSNSQANLYTAGLFGYVLGNNLNANEEFKNSITTTEIDGKIVYNYRYLFNGNYGIKSLQNGKENENNTFGKSIAGGIVAKGLFNINALSENQRSEIFISSEQSSFEVSAIQTSSANHIGGKEIDIITDKEHCIAGLVFGVISKEVFNYTFKNINIYANNANVLAIREIGSLGIGDLSTGGFIGYSMGTSYSNISLYLNNGSIKSRSLSYETKNTQIDTNNTYCGGFIGDFRGPNATMNNIKIDGYDFKNQKQMGTTTKIESIQNTIPGGGDYRGENYTGGLIGRIYQVSSVNSAQYIGSSLDIDRIQMQGHESPDSAFCGGLIGFIKNNAKTDTGKIMISNCMVKNAFIDGRATTTIIYGNPDIYVSGLVGACYTSDAFNLLYIENSKVYNSTINCLGNERIEAFASGILGAATWAGTHYINDCYVYGSKIVATSNSATNLANPRKDNAYVAGICSHITSTTINVNHCVVIDSLLDSISQNGESFASGMVYHYSSSTIRLNNCYTNAYLNTSKNNYPITNMGTCNRSYYVLQNITNVASNLGIALDFSRQRVNGKNVSITSILTGLNNNDGVGKKILPILKSNEYFSVNNGGTNNIILLSYIGQNNDRRTNVINIWINAKEEGSSRSPNEYDDFEAMYNDGWFDLGEIIIYNREKTTSDENNNIEFLETYYIDHDNKYVYDRKTSDGKTYLKNINYPFNLIQSGYEEINGSDVINDISVIREYIVKIYDNMPYMQLQFKVKKEVPIYLNTLWDSNGDETIVDNDSINGIGELKYTHETIDEYTVYTIIYVPNQLLKENQTFYLSFKIGSSDFYAESCLKFSLKANKKILNGVTFAEYTPPINYYLEGIDKNLGVTKDNPYLLRVGSITKFIPIIQKVNDLDNTQYNDDTNVEYVIYESTYGTIKSSGDLIVNNISNQVYKITVTLKDDPTQKQEIYFKVIDQYSVSYTTIGANMECITYASSSSDYYFKIASKSNYSSIPNQFIINIGGNTYDLLNDFSGIRVYTNNMNQIDAFIDDVEYYEIYIPSNLITGEINISIVFPIIYTITLDLQCSIFNHNFIESEQKIYRLVENTNFKDFFTVDLMNEINEWVKDATVFGYVFTGFYLVSNASSENAYGESLDSIKESDMKITTSLTFYARWSFLIELVEAPGTKIVTSFADSYMKDYYEENLLNKTIKIPINNNRGYVFTVSKEDNFVGEAYVEAFIINLVGEEKQITEIPIEKYFDNMYLYYIAPEKITGYLVIVTSISNSELIVGESTASVREEILPEDGIYTFKYIVNHKNTKEETSYIYDSGIDGNHSSNLFLNKDFLLQFKQQSLDGSNMNIIDRTLDLGTIIDVYYRKVVNGIETDTIVGTYKVKEDNISQLKLSAFTLWDLQTPAFPIETFQDFLGDEEEVSEVYYFVITPPNGIHGKVEHEIINYIVYAGYYNSLTEDYVEGIRNNEGFANIPIEDTLIDRVMVESSKQSKIYSVTPSRNTDLIKNEDSSFTFIDKTTFNLSDLVATDAKIENGIFYLFDDEEQNSIIVSKEIKFGINALRLTLRYNLGTIDIYGSDDGDDWHLVDTISVNTLENKIYEVDFSSFNYNYFKIDNTSLKEIHLKEIEIIAKSNGISYKSDFSNAACCVIDGNIITYNLNMKLQGDIRHDGKTFILATQFIENNNICENIDKIQLKVAIDNQIVIVDAIDYDVEGKNVFYFNLSSILQEYNLEQIRFTIVMPETLSLYAVQLLESTTIYKPAMSEVRTTIMY